MHIVSLNFIESNFLTCANVYIASFSTIWSEGSNSLSSVTLQFIKLFLLTSQVSLSLFSLVYFLLLLLLPLHFLSGYQPVRCLLTSLSKFKNKLASKLSENRQKRALREDANEKLNIDGKDESVGIALNLGSAGNAWSLGRRKVR